MAGGICKNIINTGACTDTGCRFNHEVLTCELCKVWCVGQITFSSHLGGRQHRENEKAKNAPRSVRSPTHGRAEGNGRPPARCAACDSNIHEPYATHITRLAHRMRIAELERSGQPIPRNNPVPAGPTIRCGVCDRDVDQGAWLGHMRSAFHAKKERFAQFSRALVESGKDKQGVRVLEQVGDMGIVEIDSLALRPTVDFAFSMVLDNRFSIELIEVRATSSIGRAAEKRQKFFFPNLPYPLRLTTGRTEKVRITFNPQGNLGRYQDRIEFIFDDLNRRQKFVIARQIVAVVGVAAELKVLQPTAPYVPPKPRTREPEKEVVEGIPPPALAAIRWTVPLPQSPLPAWVSSALEGGSRSEKLGRVRATLLPSVLDCMTYGRHWKTLLWIEEEQMTSDMEQYDMKNVGLEAHRDYYFLKVPGLAEKRPSVIVGDGIKVRSHGSHSGAWFKGYVHEVRDVEVGLRFHPSFTSFRGQRYDVHFELGRLPLRRMHQALDSTFFPSRVLFPTPELITYQRPTNQEINRLRPVNRLILTNPPQLLAVASIVYQPPGSPPFVVFGPPGTGKTITIVEAIRQILIRDPDARILACAPSNSASDIIAERLTDLNKSTLFRLNAPSRPRISMPRSLLDFSTINSEGTFAVPPLAILKKFRMVVATCISGAVPHGIGMARGHFTHIFIDESGQACEPEAMIPIKTLAGPETNIILSGDPKQLGPIVRSPISQTLGLGTSYLDRLMGRPVYDDKKYNGITVVKLIKNWRSHPSILKFPNEEFYRNELEPHADPIVIESLLNWEELPTPGFPIIFHSIKGQDMRQADSPSFFNPVEVSLVKKYVDALRMNSKLRIANPHIGIISPYNAQVGKIRTILRPAYPDIKIGSVEEFQGQERRIIIISTVRSSMDYVAFDLKHTLGFVSSPRRLNVAITRAQAALIVVGDADVLGLDPLWREFLNYVHQQGGWRGPQIPWNSYEVVDRGAMTSTGLRSGPSHHYAEARVQEAETEMDELVARTRAMVLGNIPVDDREDEDEDGHRVDSLEGNADRPWREAE